MAVMTSAYFSQQMPRISASYLAINGPTTLIFDQIWQDLAWKLIAKVQSERWAAVPPKKDGRP
jgi:hypothetical protein